MRALAGRFAHEYGARPLHLVLLLASLFLTAYAIARMMELGGWQSWIVLIVGAAVLHDLVFLPLYSLLDRVAQGAAGPVQPRGRMLATLNHVRLPALISGALLLLWFPLIFGLGETQYLRKTGLQNDVYLERWLLVTGILFLGSAVIFAIRQARPRRRSGRSEA